MVIHTDVDAGWVASDGDPRWRSTIAARERIMGAELVLSIFARPRRTHVIHLKDGRPVAVLKQIAGRETWLLSMEGFQFWHFNRVLGKEHYSPNVGFGRIKEAHTFVKKVLADSSAHFTRKV